MKIEKSNAWYENGRWRTYVDIYVPVGRGLFLSPRMIFLMEGFNSVEGCFTSIIKKQRYTSHAEYISNNKKLREHNKQEVQDVNYEDLTDNLSQAQTYARSKHIPEYLEEESDKNAKGVVYFWKIIISSNDLSAIDKQVDIIKNRWTGQDGVITDPQNPLKYFELDWQTGRQLRTHNNLLKKIYAGDADVYTSTNFNYAGLSFYSTMFLQDPHGVPVGYDTLGNAIVGTEGSTKPRVLIDFVNSTDKQAIIAIPKQSSLYKYRHEDSEIPQPIASVLAQAVANQFSMEGHKIKHIVLNEFNYEKLKNTRIFKPTHDDFDVIDVKEVSVNVLEPFGKEGIDAQDSLFKYMQEKLVLIIDILNNFSLSDVQKSYIRTAYSEVIVGAGLWSNTASSNRVEQKLLNQPIFPVLSEVLRYIERQQEQAVSDKMESLYNELTVLVDRIKGNINQNRQMLASYTTLRPSDARQVVYSFENIEDSVSKNVQFINLINFISSTVESGDVIFVHGTDRLFREDYGSYLKNIISLMQNRGGIIIYCFDNTISTASETNFFQLGNGELYEDFKTEFDWAFFGRMTDSSNLEYSFGETLSPKIKVELSSSYAGRTLFWRRKTKSMTIVDLNPFV